MDLDRAFTGIIAITRYSIKKLLFSRKAVISALVAVFVAAVMGYAGTQDVEPLDEGVNLLDTLILLFFMPVMAMIYGSSLIRDEIDDKSITHVATAPLDRAYSYAGYYVPLVIAVAISMIIINTAGFLAFFSQKGIDSDSLSIYLAFTGLVIIGSVVYSALFLSMGVLFKKPVFFGLFYAFIWEAFIGSLPGVIQKASIRHYLRSIGFEWVDYGSISHYEQATGFFDSVLVIIVLTIIFLVLGAYLFREKELA